MKTKDFLSQVDHKEVVAAIQEAEQKTSGEIRVFISRKLIEAPVSVAQGHFLRMGMNRTREHNGVLIFVAPRSRKFAVIGDSGVHTRCGEEFWRQLAQEMTAYFRRSEFTIGLVHGIRKAGELLAEHFPHQPDDQNELPDEIEHD
jgi:uncharacterized membrane protein